MQSKKWLRFFADWLRSVCGYKWYNLDFQLRTSVSGSRKSVDMLKKHRLGWMRESAAVACLDAAISALKVANDTTVVEIFLVVAWPSLLKGGEWTTEVIKRHNFH